MLFFAQALCYYLAQLHFWNPLTCQNHSIDFTVAQSCLNDKAQPEEN